MGVEDLLLTVQAGAGFHAFGRDGVICAVAQPESHLKVREGQPRG